MAPIIYGTYFNHHWLPVGLALFASLKRHHQAPFEFWVMGLDQETYEALSGRESEGLHVVRLEDFEVDEPAVAATRSSRSMAEYNWTCKPAWTLWLMRKHSNSPCVVFLDADLFFFADPAPAFAAFEGFSICAVEHRFPATHADAVGRNGRFNAGFFIFRNDATGLACLERWRSQCIEWCYGHWEEGKFGDQGYVDEWSELWGQAFLSHPHKGVNVGPWNMSNHPVSRSGGNFLVGGDPLICFHFHKPVLLGGRQLCIDPSGTYHLPSVEVAEVYRQYGLALHEAGQVGVPMPDAVQLSGDETEQAYCDLRLIDLDEPMNPAEWSRLDKHWQVRHRLPVYHAFEAYHAGDLPETRRRLKAAFRLWPRWRFDRQVFPVWLEAMAGRKFLPRGRSSS